MTDKSDRELLELAARAAGVRGYWNNVTEEFTSKVGDGEWEWNPLQEDGDALRLAVNLRMDISVGQSVKVVAVSNDGETVAKEVHVLDNNPYTTTRRAIVRAAAAIGESMGGEA